MNDELKPIIEDAAKLLGLEVVDWFGSHFTAVDAEGTLVGFNPLDPERGDLMKVAMAAELVVNHRTGDVYAPLLNLPRRECEVVFKRDDHQSLALAILRAASAVYKSRGGV